MEALIKKIQDILNKELPSGCYIYVNSRPHAFGNGNSIAIMFAATDYNINQVRGQRPQAVSLSLDLNDMELIPQVYGGNGGRTIYREPNLNDPSEKYLAMKSVKVPFRQPQKNETAVLKAIEKFAQNWRKTIRENIDTILYKDLVDYSKF